jgi:hypothetical protein
MGYRSRAAIAKQTDAMADTGAWRALLDNAAQMQASHRDAVPNKNYKFVIFLLQQKLRICNLARHVHKAPRHMAIFDAVTITQRPSVAGRPGNINAAFHSKALG